MVGNFNWRCKPVPDKRFINLMGIIGKFDMSYGPWIAGGSVRKLWQNAKWTDEDVDIFFPSRDAFKKFTSDLQARYNRSQKTCLTMVTNDGFEYADTQEITELFGNVTKPTPKTWTGLALEHAKSLFKSKNPDNHPYIDAMFSSDNAITFTFSGLSKFFGERGTIKIQCICKDFPSSAEELVNSFDWTICQFVSDGKIMWAPSESVRDLENNQIVTNIESNKVIKVPRLMKYISYGFEPSNELMLTTLRYLESGAGKDIADDY